MFCPKCGSNISIDAKFCPDCGANLEKAKYLLKESPGISDISEPDSIIELSLDGDAESLIVLPNTRKKFYLKVKNNSKSSLYDVEVILSGPPQVELILQSRFFPIIRAMGTNSIPLIILPRASGIFTLTAKLHSNIGFTITLPIELRVVAPTSTEDKKIIEEKYEQHSLPPMSRIKLPVELRTVVPTNTENREIQETKFFHKESPGISDISVQDPVIELSLEGDAESLIVLPNTRKKFYLKVKNNSNNHLYDVEVILSGPPQVELILQSRFFPIIRAMGTNSIPLIILPRTTGIFTLTANLHSNIGFTITLSIELRVVVPTITENRNIQEAKYIHKESPGIIDISDSDSVIELRAVAPTSTENRKIQETKYFHKESPGISDISEPDSIIELSLEGDAESLIVLANTRKKFYLNVKNNSTVSLHDVEVTLSGPPEVEIVLNSRKFPLIRAKGTNSIPFIIILRTPGVFTLTAKLHSNTGLMVTLPIEVRAVAPAITVPEKIQEVKYFRKDSLRISDISESDSVIGPRNVAPTSIVEEKMEVTKYILKESTGKSEISKSDSVIELSLEGDPESLIVLPNTRKKFYLKVKNKSKNPLHNVEVILSGPPEVDILLNSRKFPKIRAMGTNSIPFIIILRTSDTFTLTAKLHSDTGLMITLPIELQEAKYLQQTSTPLQKPIQKPIQRPLGGKNDNIAIFVLFALIGLISMISGILMLLGGLGFRGGSLAAGITLIVVGFIFLSIGTKGKCCVLPFYCANC